MELQDLAHADVGDTEEGRRDRSVGSRGSQPRAWGSEG